jgi:hypothetical protein
LLTFFSRTINQYLLPEVEVRYTSRGSLHNETKPRVRLKSCIPEKYTPPEVLAS